LNLTQV